MGACVALGNTRPVSAVDAASWRPSQSIKPMTTTPAINIKANRVIRPTIVTALDA